MYFLWKVCDGSETDFTLTMSGSSAYSTLSGAVLNAQDVVSSATATGGANANPNPPNLNAIGHLWVAEMQHEGRTVSSYPTNYTHRQESPQLTTASIALAFRQLSANSEDPGTYTDSGSSFWTAATIAFLRPSTTASITADGVIQGLTLFTADAVIQASVAGSLTANADLLATSTASFSADALIAATITSSISGDAVILATVAQNLAGDGIVLTTTSASLTADAAFSSTVSVEGNITADAVILATLAASVAGDAVLRTTSPGSITADGIVRVTTAASFSVDAVVPPYFVADAVLLGLTHFTADAIVRLVASASFTADAVVFFELYEFTFTADALIFGIVWFDDFNRANENPLGDPYRHMLGDEAQIISNELVQPYDTINSLTTFSGYRGYAVVPAISINQIDIFIPASPDNNFYLEIDNRGILGSDGQWYGQFWWMFWDSGSDFLIASDSLNETVTLTLNTWYTIKVMHGDNDHPTRLKYWPRATTEPSAWQVEVANSFSYATEPFSDQLGLFLGSGDPTDTRADNFLIASTESGAFVGFGSLTAAAVLFKTQVFAGVNPDGPEPYAVSTGTANGLGGSLSFLNPPGAVVGDFAVVIGAITGAATTNQIGGVGGSLSDTIFTKAGFWTPSNSNLTFAVFYATVTADFFGGWPSISWSWSSGSSFRAAVLLVIRRTQHFVRNVTPYFDTTSTDQQTIPAGTAELAFDNSLAILGFGSATTGVTSFLPPINAVEWADVNATNGFTHVALEVALSPQFAGSTPAWTADSQGANTGTYAVIVEVPTIAGLTADAYLKGNAFTLDAYLIPDPNQTYPVIFEDRFDDRITTNGWGGVWQPTQLDNAGLTADGTAGVNTADATYSLTGYPLVGAYASYAFDLKFVTRSTFSFIRLESNDHTGLSLQLFINGAGGVILNGVSGSWADVPNQWFSVLVNIFPDRADVYLWPRGTAQPGVRTIGAANIVSTFFETELDIAAPNGDVRIDNFVVASLVGTWQRRYLVFGDAIVKRTMTTHAVFGFPVDNTILCEAEIARGFKADAVVTNATPRTVTANAVLVTYFLFHADAVLHDDTRVQHARSGPDHTGVDYELVHTLAASIGFNPVYLAGTNLRDLLIAIDERLSELEASQ